MNIIWRYLCSLWIALTPATYLPDGQTFHQMAELYYEPYSLATYGFVTRYGSDDLAMEELYRLSREYVDQKERGYVLLGAGYGYKTIDGREYLLDNRASLGYQISADANYPIIPNHNQQNLAFLASMTYDEMKTVVEHTYLGVISVKSPNDIGREFCVYNMETFQMMGTVIVGGVAARHDWGYYGNSVNDFYGHLRIGQRTSLVDGVEFYWVADVSNRVWQEDLRYIALLPTYFCSCEP